MQTDVLISFIIPAYNAADTIEKAVQSLTDVPRTEVLIVEMDLRMRPSRFCSD